MALAKQDMGVIFDLDGVLVDTGWAHKQAWQNLAETEGFRFSDEFFYSTFGMSNHRIIPMLLGPDVTRKEVERLSELKERHYRELVAQRLHLAEGAESLLIDLKSNGFRLAVGSSAPRANLDLMLNHLSLHEHLDACVTNEDVSRGKPAPDTFLKAAEKLSLPPSRCAVVEDAVQGVEAGKAAAMPVVAVTTTRAREDLEKADLIVDSLAELRAGDFVRLLMRLRA